MKQIKLKAEHNRLESLLKDYKGKSNCEQDIERLRYLKQVVK